MSSLESVVKPEAPMTSITCSMEDGRENCYVFRVARYVCSVIVDFQLYVLFETDGWVRREQRSKYVFFSSMTEISLSAGWRAWRLERSREMQQDNKDNNLIRTRRLVVVQNIMHPFGVDLGKGFKSFGVYL